MKYIRKNGIKDPGSAITHGIALILAVVGTLPLLLKAAREPDHLHVVAMAVFMLSMILLYLASTVYHTFDVNGKVNRRLKKFDHMMISVLIAGSYTPILSDCAAWTDGNCTLCIGVGSSNWRNSCQGILDQLSEVVFLSVVYRNGMAVCTGISSAVSGSFTAGIWMVAGGRHHLHGRRGDLLLKNADV